MRENKKNKPIIIRPLTIKDLSRVVAIQEAVTKTKVSPPRRAFLKAHIQKESSVCLVALAEGEVVGYIISEILTNSFGLDEGGWIQNFGVLPKYMGQGIGRTLAWNLFKTYRKRKIDEIYTAVRWDSVDLLSFFKSIGFDRSNFINLYKKLE
jgi:ribosomal protein S18 acetylase RimI-like enzyme